MGYVNVETRLRMPVILRSAATKNLFFWSINAGTKQILRLRQTVENIVHGSTKAHHERWCVITNRVLIRSP